MCFKVTAEKQIIPVLIGWKLGLEILLELIVLLTVKHLQEIWAASIVMLIMPSPRNKMARRLKMVTVALRIF